MKTIIYHDDVDGITAAWAVTADRKRDRFVCANYGEAARKMGGGGHPNAAGFELPNLAALEAL